MVVATSIGKDLWQIGIPVAEKAIRTGAVYGGIIVLLRLGGKRDLAQLNSFDLVVLLLLSNVVQNAVIGNDNSLAGGLFGAGVLVGVNAVVVRTVRRSDATYPAYTARIAPPPPFGARFASNRPSRTVSTPPYAT